ncbi:MAG: zinc ribbon domain-containing protein [Myxococcota bacterium]
MSACSECGRVVNSSDEKCPECGAYLEPSAPVGTWSESSEPERPRPSLRVHEGGQTDPAPPPEMPLATGGAVVALALQEDEPKADATGTQPKVKVRHAEVVPIKRDQPADPPPRPPKLASELLAEDLWPSRPFERPLRVSYIALSVLGLAAVVPLALTEPAAWVTAGLFGVSLLIGLAPVRYDLRAYGVVFGSIAGSVASLYWFLGAASPWLPALVAGVVLLGAGLIGRSAFRASNLTRAMVAIGIVSMLTWLVGSAWGSPLTTVEANWQSYLPAGLRIVMFFAVLLSLVAFMDSSTTGGSAVWAIGVLSCFVLQLGLIYAVGRLPLDGPPVFNDALGAHAVGAALFPVLLALGIAQSLAIFLGGRHKAVES